MPSDASPSANRWWPWFDLFRLPLLPTAIADAWCVYLLVAPGGLSGVRWDVAIALTAMSAGLYGFGMGLNDVVDARRDAAFGWPRPIAQGRLSRRSAALAVAACGVVALLAAAWLGWPSVIVTAVVLMLAAIYDLGGKRVPEAGLLLLGAIRGAQALAVGVVTAAGAIVALLLLVHITMLSSVAYRLEGKSPPLDRGRTNRLLFGLSAAVGAMVFALVQLVPIASIARLVLAGGAVLLTFWVLATIRTWRLPPSLRGPMGVWLIRTGIPATIPMHVAIVTVYRGDYLAGGALLLAAVAVVLLARWRRSAAVARVET